MVVVNTVSIFKYFIITARALHSLVAKLQYFAEVYFIKFTALSCVTSRGSSVTSRIVDMQRYSSNGKTWYMRHQVYIYTDTAYALARAKLHSSWLER